MGARSVPSRPRGRRDISPVPVALRA